MCQQPVCNANKQWLQEIAAIAAGLPDGRLFGKKIYERCDAVTKEYKAWNSPNGSSVVRAKYHARIKKKVNELSAAYGRRTALLEKEVDLKVYEAFYTATEKLILAVPTVLTNVAERLAKFPK